MYKKIVQNFIKSAEADKNPNSAALVIAYKSLALQIEDNERRASDLVIANTELAFQNKEKENRAAELIIANVELAFQNSEKENRAAELAVANIELHYQNTEKEKRAAELLIANEELAFQNIEKENRAAELIIANSELIYQNNEKEKRAVELTIANKELESFAFISSHDLQEPLRKIQTFSSRILQDEYDTMSENGKHYFLRIQHSALRMQTLIQDLLAYSRTTESERTFEKSDLNVVVNEVLENLKEELHEKKAVVELVNLDEAKIIPFQFRQLLQNLIANSIKFCRPNVAPKILIRGSYISNTEVTIPFQIATDHYHIEFTDNGIGFHPDYNEKIFDLFQRLHKKDDFEGTGIGLSIVKKIVNNHKGVIFAKGDPGNGAQFNIYIPV